MKASKRLLASAAVVAAFALGSSTPSHASDHIDGLKTAVDNAADITDVFAFTSPKDPNKLVLIMNVHGTAFSRSRFSNAVDYRFRLRPIDDAKTLRPSADASKERGIVCSFSGGLVLVDANQRATCRFELEGGNETITFATRGDGYRAGGSAEQNGIRVFAGVRSDPWFLDLAKTLQYNNGLPVPRVQPGVNGLWGQNVLSIVVELDKSRVPGPLLAVNAQTVRK